MMTNAELKFLETVPMYLKDIVKALNEIKEELKRTNDGKCDSSGFGNGDQWTAQDERNE